MNRIVALSFSLAFASVLANGQDLTKEAKIERIVALEYASSAGVDVMKPLFASKMPGVTPEQQAKSQETQRRMLDSMKAVMDQKRPEIVKVYSETFSAEEIDGILAFYLSPAGQALLEKRPLVMSKTMTLLVPDIQRLAKEAMAVK